MRVKKILSEKKVDIPIISKIEKPEAIDNIESIIDVSDCIMIARGDMGVEVGNHLVPLIQKKIINLWLFSRWSFEITFIKIIIFIKYLSSISI